MSAPVVEMDMALVESRTLRVRNAERVDALYKVKMLALLPDDVHATTEIVADYYEVPVETIKSLVKDNREELEANGYKVLTGRDLRTFARSFGDLANPVGPKTRSLALFNRRAILNVGMLLRDSEIACRVRQQLLEVEAATPPAVRAAIADQPSRHAAFAAQFDPAINPPETYSFAEVCALLRQFYGIDLSVVQLTRMLRGAGMLRQDGVPRRKYEAYFYFADGTWYVVSHMVRRLIFKVFEHGREIQDFRFIQTRLEMQGMPSWPTNPSADGRAALDEQSRRS